MKYSNIFLAARAALHSDTNRINLWANNVHPNFTFLGQLRATLFSSWINVLLVLVPVGIAFHYADMHPIAVFVVNFVAIIPLAAMLGYGTEELALRTGDTVGGLLNASFGNAVELIVSIIALIHNEILIVQTSLIGSILSNLLLVLGMCFFFGGLHCEEQNFNVTVAQTASSMLGLAIGSLIIPTALFMTHPKASAKGIAPLSRGTCVLLLLVYGCYLYFQLRTHSRIYNEPSQKAQRRQPIIEEGKATRKLARMGVVAAATLVPPALNLPVKAKEEAKEEAKLWPWVALLTLVISTALVGICAEFMVQSIDALVKDSKISKTFIGLILLPIVGNATEHATAVTVACKDKMGLAIGVAIGSSLQIALLVIPFIVILGWILHNSAMTLLFDGFQVAILFVAVLVVNYLIRDGKSNWLEGVLLQALYIMIAIAAWYIPFTEETAG